MVVLGQSGTEIPYLGVDSSGCTYLCRYSIRVLVLLRQDEHRLAVLAFGRHGYMQGATFEFGDLQLLGLLQLVVSLPVLVEGLAVVIPLSLVLLLQLVVLLLQVLVLRLRSQTDNKVRARYDW